MIRLVFLVVTLQLLGLQTSFAAEPIGRLFSTPEERDVLNSLREASKQVVEEDVKPTVKRVYLAPKRAPLPGPINLQGYVKRTDGKKGTVWVNGKAIQERTRSKDVQVGRLPKNSNRVPIRIPANGKQLTLKAGQTYDPRENKLRKSKSYRIERTGRIGDANSL